MFSNETEPGMGVLFEHVVLNTSNYLTCICGLIISSYICLISIVPGVMKAMNHRLSTCVC